jgi:hypothetical protein
MTLAKKTCLLLVGWSFAHYSAVHMYEQWCTPLSPLGFLLSPVMISTPHCTALRWIIHEGACNITNSWSLLAGFAIAYFVK